MAQIRIARYGQSLQAIRLAGPVVATIGNFDGVHAGHKQLIETTVAAAGAGGSAVVISFYPHPQQVISGATSIRYLSTIRTKLAELADLGVKLLYLVRFTEFIRGLSPAQFVDDILIDRLNISELVLGPDAHIGKGRAGSVEVITELMAKKNRRTSVVPFVQAEGTISSRRIRDLVTGGEVAAAAKLLGRNFSMVGHTAHGDARGAKIGFKTANLLPGKRVLPAFGVYATRLRVAGQQFNAVTNVGVRPTFGGERPVIETHILDYQGPQIYGKIIAVEFVGRIRAEQKFPSADALQRRIVEDIRLAREILN